MIFQCVAEVTEVKTLAKGIKVTLLSSEIHPEEMAHLFGLIDKQGYFLFKEESIKEEELALPEIQEPNTKTPSQRLRAVIHVFWEQSGGLKRADGRTSEEYYKFYMEKIIDSVKQKLST